MKILCIAFIITMVSQKTYAACQIKSHILDCNLRNITSISLTEALNVNSTQAITQLLLNDNNIDAINTTVFRKFENLKAIYLSGNRIRFIADNAFHGMSKLHTIHLDRNILLTIPTNALKVRSLKTVNLDGNDITTIKDNSFQGNRLENISIKSNRLRSVEKNAFSDLRFSLSVLSLGDNYLTEIPSQAIRQLSRLAVLDIAENKITYIPKDAFRGMTLLRKIRLLGGFSSVLVHPDAFRYMKSLRELKLNAENLKISKFPNLQGTNNIRVLQIRGITNLVIPPSFCKEKTQLRSIQVESSNMSIFPRLSECEHLSSIDFRDNEIDFIPKDAFSGLKLIEDIKIIQFNTVGKIHRDAFTFLPSLEELDLSHYPLGQFPNLTGTRSLRVLTLQGCSIRMIPLNVCKDLVYLEKLDLAENHIKTLPSLTKCASLEDVTFYRNMIKSVGEEVFRGLKELEYLDLSDNHIGMLGGLVFQSNERLHNLNLSRNMLEKIHEDTFKNTKKIEVLDISKNYDLAHLPSKHLHSLRKISIEGNKKMVDFPTQEDLPRVRQLSLVYEYHCCFFLRKVQQISRKYRIPSETSTWKVSTDPRIRKYYPSSNITKRQTEIDMDKIEPLLRLMNNGSKIIFHDQSDKGVRYSEYLNEAYCTPQPNAFYPCDDLMGKEWLRICVWVVFLFSLCGNIAVLVVSLCNWNKIDVPRYLILNLSFADLCLSIYLGFLSFVDIATIGDFRSHALDWQFSGSCKAAGFLAVFAAELSVYTLVVITIERFTTIRNSMHVHRRINMKQAILITFIGWIVSITLAGLPLQTLNGVKFSDYSKYSVCLPFEVEQTSSKIYVIVLLVFNILGFLIILVCYVQIYFHIRGSNAWNSGDMRVARRMAILVFTDLFCWFPIVLTALCAIFHKSILSNLWMSKVLTVFVFPLNACANPFLYAILTKQFRKDVSSLVRKIKEKSPRKKGSYRMSILKMPLKGSFTYSSSVRRGSSCSFLFTRRWSSKTAEEIKFASKEADLQRNGCYSENYVPECEERLTTV